LGVSLFVERPGRANAISLEEWGKLVADEPDLRLRAEPYAAINPKTGEQVLLPVGDADSEMHSGMQWHPFLRFARGKLVMEYQPGFANPDNELRLRIASISRALGAQITTDADDEPLNWSQSE